MEWMMLPVKRYADFSGRSRRKEYWMFMLGVFILYAIVAVLFLAGGGFGDGGGSVLGMAAILIGVVVVLGLLIPSLAVQVRRFHDQNRSGWMVLINFVPYVGGLIVFIFMLLPGTSGPNRFGPDPLQTDGQLGEIFS